MSVLTRIYNRIVWKNSPAEDTPLNATNLNSMDSALYEIDGRVVTLNDNIQPMLTGITVSEDKNTITFSRFGQSPVIVTTNLGTMESNAEISSKNSKSYAVGGVKNADGTDYRTGQDTDNSKYYYEQAKLLVTAGQVQADWDETDTDSPSFIKNKPSALSNDDIDTLFASTE